MAVGTRLRAEGLVTSSAPLNLLKASDADAGSDGLAAVDDNAPKEDTVEDEEEDGASGRLKPTLLLMLCPEVALALFSPSPSLLSAIRVAEKDNVRLQAWPTTFDRITF